MPTEEQKKMAEILEHTAACALNDNVRGLVLITVHENDRLSTVTAFDSDMVRSRLSDGMGMELLRHYMSLLEESAETKT